jgi:hypothetical protein
MSRKTIEEWAKQKGTADWKLAAAKVHQKGWGVGKEVEESTFDKAIKAVEEIKLYAYAPEPEKVAVPTPPEQVFGDVGEGTRMEQPSHTTDVAIEDTEKQRR